MNEQNGGEFVMPEGAGPSFRADLGLEFQPDPHAPSSAGSDARSGNQAHSQQAVNLNPIPDSLLSGSDGAAVLPAPRHASGSAAKTWQIVLIVILLACTLAVSTASLIIQLNSQPVRGFMQAPDGVVTMNGNPPGTNSNGGPQGTGPGTQSSSGRSTQSS